MASIPTFLFSGQSNMQGYGSLSALPLASADSGQVYQKPNVNTSACLFNANISGLAELICPGFGAYDEQSPVRNWLYVNGQGYVFNPDGSHQLTPIVVQDMGDYGPEFSFLQKWHADHPGEPVCGIKCSLGGSRITDWLPKDPVKNPYGGNQWPVFSASIANAISSLAALGYTPDWKAMLWLQGESDCANVYDFLHPTPGATFADKTRAFFALARGLTSASMPIIIGRISNQMTLPNIINALVAADSRYTYQNYVDATNYTRGLQDQMGMDSGNLTYSRDDLPVKLTDPLQYQYHLADNGLLADGERAYAAFSQVVPPPVPLGTSFSGSATVNGVAVNLDAQSSLAFVVNPDGTLRPVLTVGGVAVNRFTPWTINVNASQS